MRPLSFNSGRIVGEIEPSAVFIASMRPLSFNSGRLRARGGKQLREYRFNEAAVV